MVETRLIYQKKKLNDLVLSFDYPSMFKWIDIEVHHKEMQRAKSNFIGELGEALGEAIMPCILKDVDRDWSMYTQWASERK